MFHTSLANVDNLIKNSVKEIVQLLAGTLDSMLYSSKKVKGLGDYKAQSEAFLQHLNACHILKKCENVYVLLSFTTLFNILGRQRRSRHRA